MSVEQTLEKKGYVARISGQKAMSCTSNKFLLFHVRHEHDLTNTLLKFVDLLVLFFRGR